MFMSFLCCFGLSTQTVPQLAGSTFLQILDIYITLYIKSKNRVHLISSFISDYIICFHSVKQSRLFWKQLFPFYSLYILQGSVENIAYPNGTLTWFVIKINGRPFSGQFWLPFYIRRLLIFQDFQSTLFYFLLIKFKPQKDGFCLYF